MQLKEVHPINFLFHRVETTLVELHQFVPVGQQLFAEAVARGHFVAGPVHWHYIGFTDVTKPFTLEIALPVREIPQDYDGQFQYKRTGPFRCVSCVHEGPWERMPESYGKLMGYIAEHKLSPLAVNREIYINVDMVHPEGNTSEIQIGIA
ncbi:GyrI-like domain-containing protein [Parachryseolinea silvisoli]|uniref:GyrI-like domain-containing protein n=1 Tax=Parachryseolinea silvisoli TaxID=2873601 RepID=UPI00226598B9|nr:GyrI-like domain-containing protein [Parachryseolinea silvisoli]MCD9013890.1 GyrI-like domain-containing protein [Parachryseolinea silvisoli]